MTMAKLSIKDYSRMENMMDMVFYYIFNFWFVNKYFFKGSMYYDNGNPKYIGNFKEGKY